MPSPPTHAREALTAHLRADAAVPWSAPPARLAERLRGLDERRGRAPLVPRDPFARDPRGGPRLRRAVALVERQADQGRPLDWARLRRLQAVLLGPEAARFRQGPAYAQRGREGYAWAPDLEARWRAKLERDEAQGLHPVLHAARLYLDLAYVHPFPDGNARAARLWLHFVLRRGGYPTPDVGALVAFPKRAGDPVAYQAFAGFLASRCAAGFAVQRPT